MSWTAERTELLKKLWTEGLSASQIAKQLGGLSRNSVIGKVHRLGLAGRATPSGPTIRRPRKCKAHTPGTSTSTPLLEDASSEAKALILPPVELAPGELVTTLTLKDSMCKWPIGDPDDPNFHYCGRPAGKKGYCEGHRQMAFQPVQRRRRKADDAEQALREIIASRAVPF